jgi:hypothetical protein
VLVSLPGALRCRQARRGAAPADAHLLLRAHHALAHTTPQLRRRNNIVADSPIKILAAEADLYVAEINSSVVLKLGPRMDMGPLLPKEAEGWRAAVWGKDFCLWERHSGAAAAAGGSSN